MDKSTNTALTEEPVLVFQSKFLKSFEERRWRWKYGPVIQDKLAFLEKEWRHVSILSALILVNLAAALDSTSISVALPTITDDLKGDSIDAFWCGTSFLVSSTLIQPILCTVSDIFGRKFAIMVSLVAFTIGAVLCAVSHNFALMLCGRVFQGLGAGGFNVMTEVLLTDLLPLVERGRWFGALGAAWAVGSACGPVIGGAVTQLSSWRWIFWLNLPFVGIALLILPVLLRLRTVSGSLSKLHDIDYTGALLFLSSLSAMLIPLTWGGVVYDWDSWHTIVPLVLGTLGLVGFVVYEKHHTSKQFIPLVIFHNTSSSLNYFGAFVLGMLLWTLLYYLPLYYEVAKGYTMVMSGVALFPETFTTAPAGIVATVLISAWKKYRWALWLGWTLATVGLGLLRLLEVDTSVVKFIFLNLTVGVGAGILYPAIPLAIQASCPLEIMPMSVTMISTARNLGRTAGVALGGSIVQNRIKYHLQQVPNLAPMATEYSKEASTLLNVVKSMRDDANRTSLKVAYARSLTDVWMFLCGVAGLVLISSLFVKSYSMDRELYTRQPLEDDRQHLTQDSNISLDQRVHDR